MGKDGNDKGVSRRELLTFWRRPLAEAVRPSEPAPPSVGPPRPHGRPVPLRPPGTMHEALLVQTCTHCGKCVEACPADAIFLLGADWGRSAGTPAIDARKQPCVLCNGLRCTHVCPSGALQPTYVNNDVIMGSALVDRVRCWAHQGQSCTACQTACPIPGAINVLEGGKIAVNTTVCVGCGVCEHVCPAEPTAIRVVPRA